MSDSVASSGPSNKWEEISFTLGENEIDPSQGTLTTEAGTIRLNNKSLRVLLCLAARAPQLVSREELLRQVWGEVFVGDAVLTTAIWELRSKLQMTSDGPLIETVRGRGYRLRAAPVPSPVIEVAPVIQDPAPPQTVPLPSASQRSALLRSKAGSRVVARWAALAAMAFGAAIVVAALGGRRAEPSPREDVGTMAGRENDTFARSLVAAMQRGDLEKVAAGLERTLAQDPDAIAARLRLAQIWALQGRWDKGRLEVEQAYSRMSDPHVFSWKRRVVRTLHALRAFERVEELTADTARDLALTALQLDGLLLYRAFALSRLGRLEEAANLACGLGGRDDSQRLGDLGYLLATLESEECARDLLPRVLKSAEGELNLAKIYLGMGKEELALKLLEELAERRDSQLVWIALDPVWDRLTDEPRFKVLLDATRR